MDVQSARDRLAEIRAAIEAGQYRKGMWQRFVADASRMDIAAREAIADDVSLTSRQVHGLNGFPVAPFAVGLGVELALLLVGIGLLVSGNLLLTLGGLAALALALQPLIKILVGLCVGIRYDYVYLWYFEPRFKMRYGTYLAAAPMARVLFHLAGSLGTPLAMLSGALAFALQNHMMAYVCLLFAVIAGLMQVGAFVAEWLGVRHIGKHRLAYLTSPATAAFELKQLRRP